MFWAVIGEMTWTHTEGRRSGREERKTHYNLKTEWCGIRPTKRHCSCTKMIIVPTRNAILITHSRISLITRYSTNNKMPQKERAISWTNDTSRVTKPRTFACFRSRPVSVIWFATVWVTPSRSVYVTVDAVGVAFWKRHHPYVYLGALQNSKHSKHKK